MEIKQIHLWPTHLRNTLLNGKGHMEAKGLTDRSNEVVRLERQNVSKVRKGGLSEIPNIFSRNPSNEREHVEANASGGRIEKYWTVERMRNAIPYPMPSPEGPAIKPNEKEHVEANASGGRIEKYWTVERMRNAIPYPMPSPEGLATNLISIGSVPKQADGDPGIYPERLPGEDRKDRDNDAAHLEEKTEIRKLNLMI